jgi:hypothetical protein
VMLLMMMMVVVVLLLLIMGRVLRLRHVWGRLLWVRRLLRLLQRRRMGMERGWILMGSRKELRLRRRRMGRRKPLTRMGGRKCSRGRGRGSGHRRRMLKLKVRVRVRVRVLVLLLGLQGRRGRQLWGRDSSGSRRLRVSRLSLGSVPQSCHWVGPPQLLFCVAGLALVGQQRARA